MKKTKELISDYLRYFLLILAIILLIILIVITLKVYQRYDSKTSGDNIQILTEEQTRQQTAPETETETESESETETQPEKETETETETEGQSESALADIQTGALTSDDTLAQGQTTENQSLEAEDQWQAEEGSADENTWVESTGDYHTIVSACNLRSYPDYGDNIIGECYAGQTVEFLGEEAGWYKISVDGAVGYIGPKFLN